MATRSDKRKGPSVRADLKEVGRGYRVVRPTGQAGITLRSLVSETTAADEELLSMINEIALFINGEGRIDQSVVKNFNTTNVTNLGNDQLLHLGW
jgi:hypothetical protein